ncbi:structure-specific endonuclease subunit SLX1 [Solanum tuberosum]|nr:PREDICTED: structure-specific endonuclease subunit SLX1 [Solanum tuberosum]
MLRWIERGERERGREREREMGKRKERREQKKVCSEGGDESKEVEENRFFACYLLTSMCPRFKGHTYIGFTVNPRRRIRQHNGEVRMGALRTKRKRPWEMILCIYGFPTNVSALQFEWAWQHPVESRAVRQAAASFKTLGGVANKIKLAYAMLTLPEWQSLNLTVNFFSTKYKMHSAGCPSLPEHMRVHICALDELPCYTGIDRDEYSTNEWENSEELTDEISASSTNSNSSFSNQDKDSTDENDDEHTDWKELDERAGENSTCGREHSYIIIDSPVERSSSILGDFFHIADKKERHELDDEFGEKQANKMCSTKTDDSLATKNAGLPSDIEVIDVFTPPCSKVRADHKRRRFSASCPEIIDLTDSPIYV